MSTQRRSHHHTSSRRRRDASNNGPETKKPAADNTPKPAAADLILSNTASAASTLILVFCIASMVQFSNILYAPRGDDTLTSSLRRSLQSDVEKPSDYLVPISDPASGRDVGILWQQPPFSSDVNAYYQCMGRRLTGKIEPLDGITPTTVHVEEDWRDSLIGQGLMPADVSGVVKSGHVDDLMVLTDQPLVAVKSLLSDKQRGRIMGLFRHPVNSVEVHFSQLSEADNNPEYRLNYIKNMEADPLVKRIVGLKPSDSASVSDLRAAIDFVKSYVVVGLTSEQEVSLRRFNKALGMDDSQSSKCADELVDIQPMLVDEKYVISKNTMEWIAIAQRSPLDMMLYHLIEKMYEEQFEIFDAYPEVETTDVQTLWTDTFNANHLSDFDKPFGRNEFETPFFWNIPRSGGSHVNDVYWCMDFTLANQVGGERRFNKIVPRHLLKEFQPWKAHGNNAKVLNVDMSTRNGIVHAKNLGMFSLKGTPQPDIIFSTQFHDLTTILFSTQHKARMFALFRHPVERAVSRFRSLKKINKAWANLSVEQWVAKDNVEANWMVRELVGKDAVEEVNMKDLEAAKVIVRDKFIVGLSSHYKESLRRFNIFMGIDKSNPKYGECIKTHAPPEDVGEGSKIEQGSPAYVTLMSVNFLDVMLYQYVEKLFLVGQADLFK